MDYIYLLTRGFLKGKIDISVDTKKHSNWSVEGFCK